MGKRGPKPGTRLGFGSKFSEADHAKWRALYEDGASAEVVGKRWGVTGNTVIKALRRLGVKIRPLSGAHRRAERHHRWKGGWNFEGYRVVHLYPDDPLHAMAQANGAVLEHRLVMARALGRVLRPDETVHHLNGKRDDNRIENLQLRNSRHGGGGHYVCLDCGSHNVTAQPLGD